MFVGHSPGVGYPSSHLIPDKLLSPQRVSSGNQPDSLSPGTIYNIYNFLFTIKIFTILCAINIINNLDIGMLQFYVQLKGRGQECPLDFLAIFKALKNS